MLITAIFSSAQSAQRVQNPAVVPYSDAYNVTMLDGSGYFKPVNKDSFNRNTQAVKSVNGKTGNVVVNKSDVGLGNVDNTSDAAKPISTATQTALNGKYNIPSGTSGQYLNGLGNPVTFPTIPTNTNELTNGAGFITSAALSGYATTSTLTSGLSTKYNTPSGTTSQYVRGDGSLATFPTIPTQNVYNAAYGIVKVGTEPTASFRVDTASLMTVSSANSTISNMNANINGKVPNSRIITINGVAQDLSADRTWTVSVTAPTYQYTARAVNGTAYQISATRATRVSYTVNVVTALSLLNLTGGGTVFLEVSANGTTGWTTINSAGISRTLSVAISLGLNETTTLNIQGEVPAGWYARLRSATTGTGSTTAFVSGQEVIY